MNKKRAAFIAVTVILTISFALMGAFVFRSSYLRLWETLCNLWNSARYYFCQMFGIENGAVPTVIEYSKVFDFDKGIPADAESVKVNAGDYFALLFNGDNFNGWLKELLIGAGILGKVLTIILPVLLCLWIVIKSLYGKANNDYNKDTLALKMFKKTSLALYQPVKRFAMSYAKFIKENTAIWVVWIAIWILNLNLASVVIEFLAYYLYFAVSYRFDTLYIQFAKLIIDLQVIFRSFPWWVLLPGAWLVFEYVRRKSATKKLRHYERRNCGFINELPIVSMTCGSMGKKKTTAVTDMALSQEVMFRSKAYELLQKNDMKFPYFPWILFEKELQACMRYKTVYNLATVKEWTELKRKRFEKHQNADLQLYGYDYKRYGLNYDDNLKIYNLFDVLSTYAQLYFIYVIESSILVTNYSIREDNVLMDEGNFPVWSSDFFPSRHGENSRHSHILDFDVLRLGKKVIEDNPNAGSFEFGVIVISEIGKERGNTVELKEVKKKTDDTNQKNDLFNSWLKMCRHCATVDNFPFIKVFTDEQRPESWGADARDLADILQVVKCGDERLSLPFYTIEDMIREWTFYKFINLYYDFRFRRGDNTLLVHILKSIASLLYRRNARICNSYGYSVLEVEKERGTMDGKTEKKKYFLMNKKIYSERFCTDCFSDYFNDMARKTKVGLNDYKEYATEKATVAELKRQNSYFINALYNNSDEDFE